MPQGAACVDEWRWRPDQRSGRCGLRANSAPGVSQTCPCIGQSLAFAVQASVTFGGAFFRGATLVLDFDVAFFLGCSLVVSLDFFLRAAWALSGVAMLPKTMQAHSNTMVHRRGVGVDAWVRLEICMWSLVAVSGWAVRPVAGLHPAMGAVTCGCTKHIFPELSGSTCCVGAVR